MGQTHDTPHEVKKSPAKLLRGSGVAVENEEQHWYIAECKPTKERTVRTMLQNAHYKVFLASRTEEKIYSNRTHHTKETILIPGKVFVYTAKSKLMDILLGFSSVWRFMMTRTNQDRDYAFVPDGEMQQMMYIIGKANNPIQITAENLKIDQRVRVMRGALEGLEGGFHKEGHASYIVIKVSMGSSHYVYTEVPIEDIQPL